MAHLTKKQEEILTQCKDYYETAANSTTYMAWRQLAIIAYGMYDGDKQWDEADKRILANRGQPCVTINKVKPIINNLVGQAIKTRTSAVLKSRTNDEQESLLAEALTNLCYYVQEDQNVDYIQTLKYKDSLICGLGWSQYIKDNDRYKCEYVHPSEIIFDPADVSPQLNNSSFICRTKYLTLDQAIQAFPKKKNELELLNGGRKYYTSEESISGEIEDRLSMPASTYVYQGTTGTRLKIIEVQYKVNKTLYGTLNNEGKYVESFNRESVENLAQDKKNIFEKPAFQVHFAFFCDNILLAYGPLEVQAYHTSDFSYIPILNDRRYDAVPIGKIYDLIDAQKDYNKRRSKFLHLLNTNRVVAAGSSFQGWSRDKIREEAARPDSVFLVSDDSSVQFINNLDPAKGQLDILGTTDREMMQISGVYNESMGDQTNATSGVAIQSRQTQSAQNNIYTFDNFRLMKKREGRLLLGMLQSADDINLMTEIVRNGQLIQSLILNRAIEIDGKVVIENDIRPLNLDVYVQEVSDFEAPSEEKAEYLRLLLQQPNGMMLMQMPTLMRMIGMGVTQSQEIAQEAQQFMGMQQQQQQTMG